MRFTKAKSGPFVIKLDMDKAYDLLEWSFIENTLHDAGLPDSLVLVIMKMVSTGSCRLLWNREATDVIKPSRGLRHGVPMSHTYLSSVWRSWDSGCRRKLQKAG